MPDHPHPASSVAAVRRSACPGLLRVVTARDGGICRIKLAPRGLTAPQAVAIADAALRWGNGAIELTNRGNLQLRGIAMGAVAPMAEALIAAGLGPSTPGGDDVRNVMLSPAHGIDPAERIDFAPLAERLLARLQDDARYHALSPKFSIQLDGGGIGDLEHAQDLFLAAGEGSLALGVASRIAAPQLLALLPEALAFDAIVAAIDLFLDRATPAMLRYRDLLAAEPVETLRAPLAERVPGLTVDASVLRAWRRLAPAVARPIGIHAQRQTERVFVAAMPPLGRVSPPVLRALAEIAAEQGDGTIRLTPWQGILLPNVGDGEGALRRLADLGFATRADQPLAALAACAGSQGCDRGKADTKRDGLRLVDALAKRGLAPDLHLTGCAKSCALARTAAFTLEAVAPGQYDLFQRDDNSPHRFGRRIAERIPPESAIAFLKP